jgi:tripartite-type tricarboxylate transporter receptor subunit TctC
MSSGLGLRPEQVSRLRDEYEANPKQDKAEKPKGRKAEKQQCHQATQPPSCQREIAFFFLPISLNPMPKNTTPSVNTDRRRHLKTQLALAWTAAGALTGSSLFAADGVKVNYPTRPIKMIVPWPPGQATDLAARVLSQEMSKLIGTQIIIDNKAGAGGGIGTDAVAKSAPDGYTILAGSSGPVTVSPLLLKTPYDVDKELIPVAMIGLSPYVLVTATNFPAKDIKELVELFKSNPGKYTFATSGTGATAHLITEAFNAALGIQGIHIPYKGSIPALTDVVSGQVHYCIETAASVMPLIRGGKLKAYGVSLEKGSAVTPGITAMATSLDLPGFDMGAWLGLMVPTGTPKEVIEKIAIATEKAMTSAEVKQSFNTIALEIDYRRSDEFIKYLKNIRTAFAEVIKKNNIKVDA